MYGDSAHFSVGAPGSAFRVMAPTTTSARIRISSAGVSHRPNESTMPPLRSDSHSDTAKNAAVNANSAHVDVVPARPATPVSKATFAVRGMAYSAPMDRYTAMENTRPKILPALDAMSTMPLPDTDTAITASAGSSTAVDRKPAIAGAYAVPASTPS